jgi:uncharacterized YigZ family protein
VAGPGRHEFVDTGSRFLGQVRPVESVAEATAWIDEVSRTYEDATHVVPAYRVRTGADDALLREHSSDDGEPNGSAGTPALNVLQRRALENCVATVTRYYGGTNLGTGGLARAYARAVTEAVDDAGVTERRPREQVVMTVPYDDSGTVRGIIESEEYAFDAAYEAAVTFEVQVPRAESEAFRDRLRSATSDRIEFE